MRLSVIIVNYNVKYFLEHCLYAVMKAGEGLDAEVIVIDNHSGDNSLEYLKPRFPGVQFISEKENIGFARACNRGLQMARGSHVLFLNPDTIVAEDCFFKCLAFFETHPDCGALGVKMIDGSGNFLKESKRSFPSPLTSLYKLFGLARLFPRSPVFSRYHLGHLDKNEIHQVEVLAGAFMMVRKEVLDKTGGFDETFFMYGEDVDLSFRILREGYKNYYYPGTTIIHFKGESTKRGSLNYVRMFYRAMILFVKKHYGGSRARMFNASIHFAIRVRALIAAFTKMLRWVGLPAMDAILILLSFWLVKEFWTGYIRTDIIYPTRLLLFSLPLFTLLYLLTAYYAGLYDRYYSPGQLVRSTTIATLVLLAIYAMLPEDMRFSRGIVVFGALLGFCLLSLLRMLLTRMSILSRPAQDVSKPYLLVAATQQEFEEIRALLAKKSLDDKIIGRMAVNGTNGDSLSALKQWKQAARSLNAKEIIFAAGKLPYGTIIEKVQEIGGRLRIRFFAGRSIIGSDDKAARGKIVSPEADHRLARPGNRRWKRAIDVGVAVLGLVSFPLQFFVTRNTGGFFKNCFLILAGKKTWIGYIQSRPGLPPLRKAVLAPNGLPGKPDLPEASLEMIDYWYAHDYEPWLDLRTIRKAYHHLGG